MAKIVHLSIVFRMDHDQIVQRVCAGVRCGHEVVVIARAPERSPDFPEDVRVHALSRHGRWRQTLFAFQSLRRLALAEDADLYHVHDPGLLPLAAWLHRCGHRVVYETHDAPANVRLRSSISVPTVAHGWLDDAVRMFESATHPLLSGTVTHHPDTVRRLRGRPAISVVPAPLGKPRGRTEQRKLGMFYEWALNDTPTAH